MKSFSVVLIALCCCSSVSNYPHHQQTHSDPELITAEQAIHYSARPMAHGEQQNSIATSVEFEETASLDPSNDDLILVTHQRPSAKQPDADDYHQIYMLTSGERQDSLRTANAQFSGDGELGEIELRHDNDKMRQQNHQLAASSIDMSDFVALMPLAEVRAIAANYYRDDAEVRRAYAFLSGPDFAMLRQHVIAVPEMASFLRYLNNSGFDIVQLLNTITKLTVVAENATTDVIENGEPIDRRSVPKADSNGRTGSITTEPPFGTTTIEMVPPTTPTPPPPTYVAEQLNGLHGLVDSILETLPQDQILATFFDKLETDERFSKLIDSIGSVEFSQILAKMQNSLTLRNLIFVLHNNGIYITRIVDSLKAYFFLGTL